jgi:hypothetical protein
MRSASGRAIVEPRPIVFDDREIRLIIASLPSTVDPQRCGLLPEILRMWGRQDLPYHLACVPPSERRATRDRLVRIAKDAEKLMQRLDALEERDELELELRMLCCPDAPPLAATRDAIAMLAAAAGTWPGRGRPRNIAALLVMRDLAAIFQMVTGAEARRRVDRQAREESGPFAGFAAAIWPVIFGSDDGLPAALKNWADTSKRYPSEKSPILRNIELRHPEWMEIIRRPAPQIPPM